MTDGGHIGDGVGHGVEAASRDRWCDFRLRGGVRALNDAPEAESQSAHEGFCLHCSDAGRTNGRTGRTEPGYINPPVFPVRTDLIVVVSAFIKVLLFAYLSLIHHTMGRKLTVASDQGADMLDHLAAANPVSLCVPMAREE
uniref:Transcriptional regulator n=1 Tax=Mesocestoides corti TaxID=53468 RepID=A0A5K3G191_MESCO